MALTRSWRDTMSTTKAWRAGMSKAFTIPPSVAERDDLPHGNDVGKISPASASADYHLAGLGNHQNIAPVMAVSDCASHWSQQEHGNLAGEGHCPQQAELNR